MKISKIETFVVSQSLDEPFCFSQWEYSKRSICIVKITTDSGMYGWGEGYGPSKIIQSAIEFFKPLILGMSVLENELIWQKMYLHSLDYSRKGVFLAALSAIDIALWDLKGKLLNLPVSILLGGRKRESIVPYATGLYFKNGSNGHEKIIAEVNDYKEQGFKAIKMKVGLGIKEDIQNVSLVKSLVGDDIDLMIDANHAYNLNEAIEFSNKVEHLGIKWFEEPLSPELYESYFELRSKTKIPIAAGECEYLRYGFLNLFQKRSVDIAQPDICAAGGLSEVKKIADLAYTFGIPIVPHSWGTGIALHAALHFVSNLDCEPGRMNEPELMIEYDRTENPLRDLLTEPQPEVRDGKMQVPNLPGLGVEVNETYLKKFTNEQYNHNYQIWL